MSRRNSGRAAASFKAKYREAARADDWAYRRDIAEQMRGLDGGGAEVQYALAYGLEQLGDTRAARAACRVVLVIDGRHEKARTRLRGLAGR